MSALPWGSTGLSTSLVRRFLLCQGIIGRPQQGNYHLPYVSIPEYLVAAGSGDAADGSTYFLYADTQVSSLISKQWTGKTFANQTTVAETVRPNSAVAYVLTPSVEFIIYIDTSSKLHAIHFDDESDEWYEKPSNITRHEVHPTGNITACLNKHGDAIVLFQSNNRGLTVFNLDTPDQTTEIPVPSLTESPLWASFVKGTLYVFYVSADDQCLHYAISKNSTWTDTKWLSHPFKGTAKQFIMEPKRRGEFEAHVLTKEGLLLHVVANEQWETLGRVDESGNFISERSVDICCVEAQNNTLTEEHLEELLDADPSIIDAIGGPLSVTPLAAACWSGNLEAVCLLLDNPYRLADPNALSPQNRTPLYYAISRSPAAHRKETVGALLDAGARVDDCYAEDGFNTPLMNAAADMGDKDLIHELLDRGASLTKKNRRGQTAVMLAEGTGTELELRPSKERQLQLQETGSHSIQKECIDVLVAIAMLIITYFNSDLVKDIVGSMVTKLHEMYKEDEDENEETELTTACSTLSFVN